MKDKRIIREKDWMQAKKNAWEWIQSGHKQYIATKILYWKGFSLQFALVGAHAMELYLKGFLIHKTGKYPRGHALDAIYRECMKYDPFFDNAHLIVHFLPESIYDNVLPERWTNYVEHIRYPESLVEKPLPGFVIETGTDCSGTCDSLDQVAYFMHKNIPQPQKMVGDNSVIDKLLTGKGYLWNVRRRENAAEIIELFLRYNKYFTENS